MAENLIEVATEQPLDEPTPHRGESQAAHAGAGSSSGASCATRPPSSGLVIILALIILALVGPYLSPRGSTTRSTGAPT